MAIPRAPLHSYPRQWFFGVLSRILPYFVRQESDLIVLTAFHGDGFRGNTRRLFEWYWADRADKTSSCRLVWLSRNQHVVESLRLKYGKQAAESLHSVRGAVLLAKSGTVLLTHGTSDFPFMWIPDRTKLVQTYHGLPTKRGEFMRMDGEPSPGLITRTVLNRRFQPIDLFLSSSDFVTQLFSARFNLPVDRFVKTGYPAYDELVSRTPDTAWLMQHSTAAGSTSRLIVYAPTFRYKSHTHLFPFNDMDTGVLTDFLRAHDLILAIRTHPNEYAWLPEWIHRSDRVLLATDKHIEQVNDLIVHASVIVTDYSSIFLEGLLRDVPPVFVPYDRSEYERGFPYDYDEVTPGPHVDSFAHWMSAVLDALEGAPKYQQQRASVRTKFFDQVDSRSTDRLWELLCRQSR